MNIKNKLNIILIIVLVLIIIYIIYIFIQEHSGSIMSWNFKKVNLVLFIDN